MCPRDYSEFLFHGTRFGTLPAHGGTSGSADLSNIERRQRGRRRLDGSDGILKFRFADSQRQSSMFHSSATTFLRNSSSAAGALKMLMARLGHKKYQDHSGVPRQAAPARGAGHCGQNGGHAGACSRAAGGAAVSVVSCLHENKRAYPQGQTSSCRPLVCGRGLKVMRVGAAWIWVVAEREGAI